MVSRKIIEMVAVLVKEYDFETIEEFLEELKNNRQGIIEWLTWRSTGGTFKNEPVVEELKTASKELLKII